MKLPFSCRIGAAVLAVALVFVSRSQGATVNLAGTGALGQYTVGADYSSGWLSVTVTNTSDPSLGGYLTGFVFDLAGASSVKLAPNPQSNFYDVKGPENAAPYGKFQFGAALASNNSTDGNFLGGGNPSRGLAPGAWQTFTFSVTPSFNSFVLSESSFNGAVPFLARFRGFDDGGSDKVPAEFIASTPIRSVPQTPVVPLPSAAWAGMSLLGLVMGLTIRRRLAGR